MALAKKKLADVIVASAKQKMAPRGVMDDNELGIGESIDLLALQLQGIAAWATKLEVAAKQVVLGQLSSEEFDALLANYTPVLESATLAIKADLLSLGLCDICD